MPPVRPLSWTEPLTIHSYDVDCTRQATLEALCRYFLEAAWNHAEALGFGFSHLAREGKVWVLSRLVVELDARPGWGEQLTLNTWPRGVQGIFALRDFELLAANGSRAAGGSSAWLILDARSRRPQRIEKFLTPILPVDKRATEREPEKITGFVNSSRPGEITGLSLTARSWPARYSDVDLNGHVNSARYIGWLMDSYSAEWHARHAPRRLEINYLGESHSGEMLSVITEQAGTQEFLHAICKAQSQEACRARILWHDR